MNTPSPKLYIEKKAWIITFYAFKGGTGRTLALTNVARYLAEERGYRVGLVDLDFESPGLPHEPLCQSLEIIDGSSSNRENLQNRIDESAGFIELFAESYRGVQEYIKKKESLGNEIETKKMVWEKVLNKPDFGRSVNISKYVVPMPIHGDGVLILMPAGEGSFSKSEHFRSNLNKFAGTISDEYIQRSCVIVANNIFSEFIRKFCLDFLIIDGRTGIGPFFPVYTLSLPNVLFLFVGLNEQNVKGSLSVLENAIADYDVPKAPVFLVVSPVPTGGPKMLESRFDFLEGQLGELRRSVKEKERNGIHYIYSVPEKANFVLPYNDFASYQEVYFIGRFPHCTLGQEYIRLAETLERLVKTDDHIDTEQTFRNKKRSFQNQLNRMLAEKNHPLRIDVEVVNLEPLSAFIESEFKLKGQKPEKRENNNGEWIVNFLENNDTKPKIQLHLWSATDLEAPWQKLLDENAIIEQNGIPDILALPQSFIGAVGGGRYDVHNLAQLRQRKDKDFSDLNIFNYEFLDTWYPGWRSLCTSEAGILGVPFSTNTTLMFANEGHLGKLCKHYWMTKGMDLAKDYIFLPSSWHMVFELVSIQGKKKGDAIPFLFSNQYRALYYEWLNVVVSLGGKDLEVVEGGLFVKSSISDPATIEGTKLFLDLARRSRQLVSGIAYLKMEDLIEKFDSEELSMYMGWSDSLRFEWDNLRMRPIKLPGESKRISKRIGKQIRIGQFIRDIRFPRRPVVDGWLFVFPKKEPRDENLLKCSLNFVDLFLNPSNQRSLLRHGFPTRSLKVVREEIDAIGTTRVRGSNSTTEEKDLFNHNYKVFLRTIEDAIMNGHAVPSMRKSPEIINEIRETLNKMIDDVNIDVEKEMNELDRRIYGLLEGKNA